ncbi:MAG: hypothetical protein NKF70_00680 [Methanobacterium sp. ERen5]|nr:MAG: hypothetical protein NKF70_00680 [Methanobacterium sp. ERen5]
MSDKMDEKGFLFTTDAVLALVVVIVLTASIVTYGLLPVYQGQNHQHLETLADSALETMEQDGTLRTAAVQYANGNTTDAQTTLNTELNTLLPSNVGYKLTMDPYGSVTGNKVLVSGDVATKVKVISGPQMGYVGRAYYKLEEVKYEDQQQNVTTTVWNFHNWLSNFSPWNDPYSGTPTTTKLYTQPYWGSGTSISNIAFSIPDNTTLIKGMFLLGSSNHNNVQNPRNPSYSANVVINNLNHNILNTSFTFLNLRPNSYETMYNYQGNLSASELKNAKNNFYVNFKNPGLNKYSDMPWFSILATYTNTLKIPAGIKTDINNFTDAAGVAVPTAQNLDGQGGSNEFGFSYDLNSGQRTFFNTLRSTTWNNFLGKNSIYSDGVPFVLNNVPVPGQTQAGCAVSKVTDINIPTGSRIFDSYLVINSYGGVDNTLVEVWNGTTWQVAFNSFDLNGVDYSDGNGYGNSPGIIYIKDYLKTGNNKVRVTVWDNAPSNDYDFVGLTNCYTVTSYSKLPINWVNFPFKSHQSSGNNQYSQVQQFNIGAEAQQAYLWIGASSTTRHVRVDYNNNNILYDSDTVPFVIDLQDADSKATGGVL